MAQIMVDTVVHTPGTQIRVSHQGCTTTDGRALDGLLLTADQCQPNTLSTISVGRHDAAVHVYVHWEAFSSANDVHITYCAETQTLFTGCGTLSATIHLPVLTIVHENTQALFWSFEWRRGFVLELGELDCYLYRSNGECVGHASVDPPYEINESESALHFTSIIAGTQSIEFPTVVS